MAKRVCAEHGCPALTDNTRCHTHTRQRDKQRGSTHARGYGKQHQRGRAKAARQVATGMTHCWRCGNRLNPLEPWDLGHCDNDRSITHGPECVSCNRGARGTCPHPTHTPGGGQHQATPVPGDRGGAVPHFL